MCATRPRPKRGDVESVDFADPDPNPGGSKGPLGRMPEHDERVAIRLAGHPVTYVVRVTTARGSGPALIELTMLADDGALVGYDEVRAVPVRRLAVTAAQWIQRCGGQIGYVDDTAEVHTQPENHDDRVWQAARLAERALALGQPVRPTVAEELHVSTKTVDRLLKRARAEGWFDGEPLPKRPPPRQRDTTTTAD